jgi:hypothetical protein
LADRERDATGHQPSAAELLRAALEKIVFFEWRISELSGELAAAHARCGTAEKARAEAEDEARAATRLTKAARTQCAELEAERARLTALLTRPAHGATDPGALDAERRRAAALEADLEQVRAELARTRAERERWLSEMIAQAKTGEEDPAALAQFISELRGEVIALRDHQKKCEALLAEAGIALPLFDAPKHRESQPPCAAEPVEQARQMWAEGRLSPLAATTTPFALLPDPKESSAARALADQCLRSLVSADSARREQAARHLVAAPIASAAPAVASALSQEPDPKTRAQLAKALAACGGDGAAEIVAQLQSAEPALVRLAALEALCAIPSRARAALGNAPRETKAAIRRWAAALAVSLGVEDLAARLAADEDASVRAAVTAARTEAPPPAKPAPQAAAPPPARPRDAVRAALQRLVLEGGPH